MSDPSAANPPLRSFFTPSMRAAQESFDNEKRKEPPDEIVAFEETELLEIDEVKGSNLKPVTTLWHSGEKSIELIYGTPEEKIVVVINIFPAERNEASDSMLVEVMSATGPTNDTRGPLDLGTLSLVSPTSKLDRVRWFYRNIYARVSTPKAGPSAVDVARKYQKFFEEHTRKISEEK